MRSGVAARVALVVIAAAAGWSLSFAGCGRDHRASQPPRNAPDRGKYPTLPPAGDCYNPFFPAIPDETMEYESTFSNNLSPYSYSVTFTEISDGSFTQHQEVIGGVAPNGPVLERTWKCQAEGLASVDYPDLSRPESRLAFETLDAAGVAIPRADRWQKGVRWTYRYSVRGKMSFGMGAPTTVDVEGTISVAAEIAPQERVDVPAGVYEAAKVQSIYNEALTMKGKAPMPINITFAVQSWYARDVGLIKSASEDLKVTTVLKSVTR